MSHKLPAAVFKAVVQATPLISIDLIVRNQHGQVLLGQRVNRPAQGFWFVPGGRIYKDETMAAAFTRLTHEELGLQATLAEARFLGPFEHFYADNVFDSDFSTHYVVLGYALSVGELDLQALPASQHQRYRWFTTTEILHNPEVHVHTQWYLQ